MKRVLSTLGVFLMFVMVMSLSACSSNVQTTSTDVK